MANLTLIYGMRLLPEGEVAAVEDAKLKLANGRDAQVTMGAGRRLSGSCGCRLRRFLIFTRRYRRADEDFPITAGADLRVF